MHSLGCGRPSGLLHTNQPARPFLPAPQAETQQALAYYHESGVAPQPPTRVTAAQLHALAGGSARQLRDMVFEARVLHAGLQL